MRNRLRHLNGSAILVALILGALLPGITIGAPQGSGYHLLRKVPLGGDGGWDYLALDAPTHRLFIAHGTHVVVVDVGSEKLVGDIPDTDGVHGIALAPEIGRGFTSNGRSADVSIFDLHSLKPIGRVKTGDNPDAIVYEPGSKRVFTMNGRSNDATAIDASRGSVVGTVALGGRPEFAVTDAGNIYVNLEDKNELVAFDAVSLEIVRRWPLAPCQEPAGLAIDIAHHRLFAGCHNKTMAVVDSTDGRIVTSVPICQGVDANRFDPATAFVFASCGDGTMTVAHEDGPDSYSIVETVPTQRGARTMELDPQSHEVYLVTAEYEPLAATVTPTPHMRPNTVPNSFVLLVYGR